MHTTRLIFLLLTSTLFLACSKDNSGNLNDPNTNLSGQILYDSNEQIYSVDLRTGQKQVYFDHNNYSLNGWDVSWDAAQRLETSSIAGDFDNIMFRFINTANAEVVHEIVYNRSVGEDRDISGLLNTNQDFIIIQPDLGHGIIVIDREGKIAKHLKVVNGKDLTLGDQAHWLPDNSIIFTFDKKFILKTSPPYDEIVPIKEMNYAEWGNINSSKDGSKLSLRIDKHIYVMNADGTNLTQVTDSPKQEREGVFSPDGTHLLIAANHQPATFHAGRWDLNIIPLDGNKHQVGDDPSASVFVVKEKDREIVERGSGVMLWR